LIYTKARRPIESSKNSAISIAVDLRERPSEIEYKLVTKYGVKVLRKWLPAGDYLINEHIVVERKTTLDFSRSLIDGRLFRQSLRMKLFFSSAFLLIEGKDLYSANININPICVRGALVSLAMRWRIPVLFSKDLDETVSFLWLIGNQSVVREKVFSFRPKKQQISAYEQQLIILNGLPGIGQNLSARLIKHFGSIEKVILVPEEELIKIRGIGITKARKIRELVTECDLKK
jgi:Fanconi anemia group M protein